MINILDLRKRQVNMQRLSNREIEVSKLISEGMSNREISDRLFISVHTVKSILENIFLKLDIHNRVILAIRYVEYAKKES